MPGNDKLNTCIDEATRLLGDPNPRAAYPSLRAALGYPASISLSPELFQTALHVLAEITGRIASRDTASIAARAASLPNDAVALFVLGMSMMGQEQYDIAATMLTRAVACDPDSSHYRAKAIAALERSGNFTDALHYLEASSDEWKESLLGIYQKAWFSVRTGDLSVAHEVNDRLQEGCKHTQDAVCLSAAARINTVVCHEKDTRGWNYILNGGILLHLSPYGKEVMNGRYAYVRDTELLCNEAILKLHAVLRQQNIRIPKVFVLADAKSQILALALGRTLGCEMTAWPDGGTDEPGLVPVYDLEELSDVVFSSLARDAPGQFLWVHTVRWADHTPRIYAADFVTYLQQAYSSPWDTRVRVGDSTGVAGSGVDLRTADLGVLANRIVDAESDSTSWDDEPEILALADAISFGQSQPVGAVRRRDMQWPGSPVHSNRF
ncbi:unnamed protein product [Clonostachys rhizophaga]|uniref:Tetratricopeptide repeat protein n=1 Tax=Clonostachys rhizophaga TaxID=160324 RepID=A0A9N9VZA7_9HYPO|nr:unnamed protein product [Clonostachys rhizophaga]